MQVIAADPGKLVHWRSTGGPREWFNTDVTFRLDWKDGQTFVVFQAHALERTGRPHAPLQHEVGDVSSSALRDLVKTSQGRPLPYDLKIAVDGSWRGPSAERSALDLPRGAADPSST
jgi:hypothetical protein